MKDDWPIATRLADEPKPFTLRRALVLLVGVMLFIGLAAVVAGEVTLSVVKINSEHIAGE